MTLSASLNRLALAIAVMILLTSSFDIFLAIQFGGTYRLCQMLAPVSFVLALLACRGGPAVPMLGALPLCLWVLVQALFIPVAEFWPKSAGYWLWLLLNVATVLSFVQLFSQDDRLLARLLRWYVASFAILSALGILQFTLPLLGFEGILVTQWWIPDKLARVNGFSYEPSYFGSYLLIGFVMTGSLRPKSRLTRVTYCLTLAGIVLSSSRISILFVIAEVLLRSGARWMAVVRSLLRERLVRRRELKRLIYSALLMVLTAALAPGVVQLIEANPAVALMFLNGTGISNTAEHSVVQRQTAFGDTLTVFLRHPFIGQSLGGVSSAIAQLNGETIQSMEESKSFEGMSVFAEALAASGIIGSVPFVCYLFVSIRAPLILAARGGTVYAPWLRALTRALVFEWAILQFNQNLLRPYLWVHIAMLSAVYAAAKRDAVQRVSLSTEHTLLR